MDGCGNEVDLRVWKKYLEQYTSGSSPILVENCHGKDPRFKPNRTMPPSEGCPYHFYRTSTDIRNNYSSIMHNLGTVEPYRKTNSSYPGCWAYPDMLQVGVRYGLSLAETKSYFGDWVIVSSPLTLSHDVNDESVMNEIRDIISNREVLAVNQCYFGDTGGVYDVANKTIILEHGKYKTEVLVYQYLSKPLGVNKVAVLLMNSGETKRMRKAAFADIPGLYDGVDDSDEYLVRDLRAHENMGAFRNSIAMSVESHDAAFLLVKKSHYLGSTIAA